MICSVPEIIAQNSRHARIDPGDHIKKGTQAVVGSVQPGDFLVGTIERIGSLTVTISPNAE
jgi:fumarylpyruvate hydrolase